MSGENIGLLADAGCPNIADPGAKLILHAHENNINVIPLVGPSSILLAMMGSGLNGNNFSFNGYLPVDKNERSSRIKKLETQSRNNNQSQIFIEMFSTRILKNKLFNLEFGGPHIVYVKVDRKNILLFSIIMYFSTKFTPAHSGPELGFGGLTLISSTS